MSFTDKYPLEPPEILFLEPSPVHPHIYSNGHVCLDILYDGRNGGWSPALTINKVVMSLRSMLASNQDKVRHPPKFSVPSPGSFQSGSVTLIWLLRLRRGDRRATRHTADGQWDGRRRPRSGASMTPTSDGGGCSISTCWSCGHLHNYPVVDGRTFFWTRRVEGADVVVSASESDGCRFM